MKFTGNDVKLVMREAGFKSYRELAKQIGVNPQTVYNWNARKSKHLPTRAQEQLKEFTKKALHKSANIWNRCDDDGDDEDIWNSWGRKEMCQIRVMS